MVPRTDIPVLLREHGIQPSAQRVAVARYVLATEEHPSADRVYARVREGFPMLSRATVYNTLNLFVAKGLLRQLIMTEGKILFDPKLEPHHHFIDDKTGEVFDIPWDAVPIANPPGRLDGVLGQGQGQGQGQGESLKDFEVRELQVVLRGRHRGRA